MDEAPFTIKSAAQRTGLSAHVIRIWEKRYSAVTPLRTETNRRLYSREHVERLGLLRRLTVAGRSISTIAGLKTDSLRALVTELSEADEMTVAAVNEPATLINTCVEAVRDLDAQALERELTHAQTTLGTQGLLQRVVAPLAHRIGELWRDGSITAAHEHFATAVLRTFLSSSVRNYAPGSTSPTLVVVTPTGQLHELGALLVCAAAANLGWHIVYLGASLPAPEIAGAARQHQARAVALSIVYPEDDPSLPEELLRLRSLLSPGTPIVTGGRAAQAYAPALDRIGAVSVRDLAHLGSILDGLRKPDTTPRGL